ncbi:hypothetical protein LROSRS0_0947 [Furfurilactobacillus rossiae]|nr:T7SS effector LXG polymorphic toxin [Furfurilactobacillus rossiae]QLE60994.1 hypothetical protein LROSRS0_0947 [Furfurilactobacillus rossiae]
MVRVNMRNVTSAAQQLKSQGTSVTGQLASVGTAMTRVPRSDNFEGAAQRSMSGYVQHVHVDATRTLTSNVEDLIREFDHLITAFKSGVDSSDSAIIDTDYLQSQKAKLSALRAELERGISKGNAGCSEAGGLASVTRLRQTAPTEIEDAERKLSQTSQKLTSFNGMSPSSRMKDITVESARVGGNIRISGGSKSGQVFMEDLAYATGAIAIGGSERKKKHVSLKKIREQKHKNKEQEDESVGDLIINGVFSVLEHNGLPPRGSFGLGLAINVLKHTNNGKHAPSLKGAGFALVDSFADLGSSATIRAGVSALGIATGSVPGVFLITVLGTGMSVEASFLMNHPKYVKESFAHTKKVARNANYKKLGAFESGSIKASQRTNTSRSVTGAYAAAYAGHYKKQKR